MFLEIFRQNDIYMGFVLLIIAWGIMCLGPDAHQDNEIDEHWTGNW